LVSEAILIDHTYFKMLSSVRSNAIALVVAQYLSPELRSLK
jgi:hypothetical protein